MKIELPGFEFEKPKIHTVAKDRLLKKIQQFLDIKTVDRSEYSFGTKPTGGFGELVIQEFEHYWAVFTTERGTNFDVAIFSNQFHAVNYFTFRLTTKHETIDWSTL